MSMVDVKKKLMNSFVLKNLCTLYVMYWFNALFRREKFIFHGKLIKRIPPLVDPRPKKILFPTIYYLDQALGWQTSIAKTLQVRGHDIVFMPFDLHFPRKNALYYDVFDGRFTSASYALFTTTLLRNLGIPYKKYSDFGSSETFTTYRSRLNNLTLVECRNFVYQHQPLGAMALNSVIHFYRRSVRSFTETEINGYKDFLAIGMVIYHILTRALDEIKPDIIMTLNGSFLDSQLHIALAKARGIRVITFEAGFMLESILLGENEPLITFPMMRSMPSGFNNYSLSSNENKQLDEYLTQRSLGKNCVLDYWGKPIFDHTAILKEIGLTHETRPDVLFTNLEWDSTLVDCDIAFSSQMEWIEYVIAYYRDHPDRTLVIRIHPAEITPAALESFEKNEKLIRQRNPQLPKNVLLLPPSSKISSYPLTDIAQRVLVYASTAGLEAAIMNKPVAVAGKVHYRGHGFTQDIASQADVAAFLDDETLLRPHDMIKILARRYAYFFFFRYHIPLHTVSEQTASQYKDLTHFNFRSETELLPGKNADMDFIIDYMLGKQSFYDRFNKTIHEQ